MKVEYEFKVRSAIDKIRSFVGETDADVILNTIKSAYDLIEDYLNKNLEGFASYGKLVPIISASDSEVNVDYEIWLGGKKLEDTKKFDEQLGVLLEIAYNDLGWEAQNED